MQCYQIFGVAEAIESSVYEDRDAIVSLATEEDLETVAVTPGLVRGQSTRSKLSNESRRCVFHSPAQLRLVVDEVSAEGWEDRRLWETGGI